MVINFDNRGSGFIGQWESNWNIQYNSSPVSMGAQPGRLGSMTFSAECSNTSKFTLDNYLSVRHLFEDRTSRWLSTFDGHVREVNTDDVFGDFSMTSLLAALDSEATATASPSGKYQRSLTLPRQIPYTIGATTYYTGGFFQTIGGVQQWNARPIAVYAVAAEKNYVYVLASGAHNGEVVFQLAMDGQLRSVWPVYSDGTDTSNPGSRHMSYADGNLWIAQVNVDRVKRFTTSGAFVNQWGGAGTGNGQFSTISAIAVNGYGVDVLYVADSALGRIQYFTKSGTYSGQFGTQGTGAGNLVFNAPNGLAIEPLTDNLFVSDQNARVREYTSNGTYIGQPMGSFDVVAQKPKGEFLAGNYPIRVAFDSRGRAFAIQYGEVYKFARTNTGWPGLITVPNSRRAIQQFTTKGAEELDPPNTICSDTASGILHIGRSFDVIEQYAGSMGGIVSYFLYYIALAKPDFPIRLMALNDTWATNELAFAPWSGNVWEYLCAFCAATDNTMVMHDGQLVLFARTKKAFALPPDVDVESLKLDSQSAGLSVEVVNYNSRHTVGEEQVYNSEADGRRAISVGINDVVKITVNVNSYPEYIRQPLASTFRGDGLYVVTDSEGQTVSTTSWNARGGFIKAHPGERPGTIDIVVQGPARNLVNRVAPFKIADAGGTPSLSLLGSGILSDPEILTIGTGVDPAVTTREVAQRIDFPFAQTAKIAYTEGTWGAYLSGTPNQHIVIRLPSDRTYPWQLDGAGVNGTGFMINTIVEWKDAQYIINQINATDSMLTLECVRYTRTGKEPAEQSDPRFEEIWGPKTVAEFEAFWSGYTAQDLNIAPLRNPFGI